MRLNDFNLNKTLAEVSSELLGRYKTAASAQASKADTAGGKTNVEKANKRFSGIVKATKKQFAGDAKKTQQSVAEGSGSMSKIEANYVDQSAGSAHCKECTMFRKPNACTLVQGNISPEGWCNHYEAKKVTESEGDPEGVEHISKELLQHIVQQVGTEGAHAIVKSLQWGDGAAKELLQLIVKDLKQHISLAESVKQRLDPSCWKGKHKEGTKIKGGVRVNNCVAETMAGVGMEPAAREQSMKMRGLRGGESISSAGTAVIASYSIYDKYDRKMLKSKKFASEDAAHAWAQRNNATIIKVKPDVQAESINNNCVNIGEGWSAEMAKSIRLLESKK